MNFIMFQYFFLYISDNQTAKSPYSEPNANCQADQEKIRSYFAILVLDQLTFNESDFLRNSILRKLHCYHLQLQLYE
jgi:hypothetical protein